MSNVHDFRNDPDPHTDREHRGERPGRLEHFGQQTSNFFARIGKGFGKKDPQDGLMEEVLAMGAMEQLRDVIGDTPDTAHDIDTTRDALQLFMDSKRIILSQELTKPSWGPKIKTRTFKRGIGKKSGGGGLMSFGRRNNDTQVAFDRADILEPNRLMHEQDQAISFNLEQSRRYHHFLWLYMAAALASVAIVIAALTVDYTILKEFWVQAMVNEYDMVPVELQGSVGLKALQVLFATIGIHLVLRQMPKWVVTGFTGIIFIMTVGMMLAIGFLYAHKTLPVDNQATLAGESTENSGLMGALEASGINMGGSSDEATEAGTGIAATLADVFGAENIAIIDAVGWLVALTMIFLVVASIGALFLLWAEHNIRNFILARDYNNRNFETARLRIAESVALQIHPA